MENISVCIIGKAPSLEGFIHVRKFNLGFEILIEKAKQRNPSYHYNPKLKLFLYAVGPPITNKEFTLFGKTESILEYLKENYNQEYSRLERHLKYRG